VTIAFEAVWPAGSPLAADLARLADGLAGDREPYTPLIA